MAEKLTPWFRSPVKPVRPGVYQVFWYWQPTFAFFNGTGWGCGWDTPTEASTHTFRAAESPLKWRGLSSNPKDTK